MTRSIRYFLLISLLLSITLASAINGVGNYLLDEQVIQPFLDSELTRVSSLVDVIYKIAAGKSDTQAELSRHLLKYEPIIGAKFFFQIWDKNDKLVMESPNKHAISLKDTPIGFSNRKINDNEWRIYSSYDNSQQIKIVIAELYNLRRELADDIARSNANILLITYPAFGLLVWLIVSFALRSITKVTNEISNRASRNLHPVRSEEIPVEIKPLVDELNKLFIRLKREFERNKRFAADAAHELRTPLAALKTHVQVALKSSDETDRNKALQSVIESVDRSSHVVAQLLTLSRLGEEETLTDMKPFDLHRLATEIIAYLAPHALEKNIEIELSPPPRDTTILGSDTAIGILIRNIVDNAIRYTPPHGEVKVSIIDAIDQIIFRVADTGPGIPAELRERVFERFYRILGNQASGSGLGLAIVSQISTLHKANVQISTPTNGIGLQFDVAFPKYPA